MQKLFPELLLESLSLSAVSFYLQIISKQKRQIVPTKAAESSEQWDPYMDKHLLKGISTLKFPNNLSIRNYTLVCAFLSASEFLSSYAQNSCIPVPYQGTKSISSHPGSCLHRSHLALTKKIFQISWAVTCELGTYAEQNWPFWNKKS